MGHHKHSLLQKSADSFIEFFCRTQPPKVINAYQSYIRNTSSSYLAYLSLASYFAYRCYLAGEDRNARYNGAYNGGWEDQVHSNNVTPDTPELHMSQRHNDKVAMITCAFASLTAFTWSVSPVIPVPQFVAIGLCMAAEVAFYCSGANYNNRQECKINRDNDSLLTKCRKLILTMPAVDLILETTHVKSLMV